MPDGISVPRVDYGPLYRATRLRSPETALEIAGAALDLGKAVYGIFEDVAFEKARGGVAEDAAQAYERWRAAIYRGEVELDETGELTIEQPFDEEGLPVIRPDDWVIKQREARLEQFKFYPRVRELINAQYAKIEAVGRKRGLEHAHAKAAQLLGEEWDLNYGDAMQQAIAARDPGILDEFINETRWMSDAEKSLRRDQARKAYEFGVRRLDLREQASEQGLESVMSDLQEDVKEGRLSLEEADALRDDVRHQEALARNQENIVIEEMLSRKNTEYLQRMDTLSPNEVFGDRELRRYGDRSQVATFVEKWATFARERDQERNRGQDPPGKMDGLLTTELLEKYIDPTVSPEQFKDWIRANFGYNEQGLLLIHPELTAQYVDKAEGKSPHPGVQSAKLRLKAAYDSEIKRAEDAGQRTEADRLRAEYQQELTRLIEYTDHPDFGDAVKKNPALLDDLATNAVTWLVEPEIAKRLQSMTIRHHEIEGRGLAKGEKLQREVEEGLYIGKEKQLATQLEQLREGYVVKATQELGRPPVVHAVAEGKPIRGRVGIGGEVRLYYEALEGMAAPYVNPQTGLALFTYREEGTKELHLRIWNGQTKSWEEPPDFIMQVYSPREFVGPSPPEPAGVVPESMERQRERERFRQAEKARAEAAERGVYDPGRRPD